MKLNLAIKVNFLPKSVTGITERYSTYILPVIVGLVVFILLLFVIRPRIGAIFQLRGKITEAQKQSTALNNKLTTLKSLNPDQLLTDVRKAEIALPSEKDVSTFLSSLEKVAAETGVTIVAVQLTPGEITPQANKGQVEEFPIKATIAGSFSQIKSFLGSLANSPRVIAVRSLTLTSGAPTQQASLSASFNLESFFQTLSSTKFTTAELLQNLTPEEQQVLAKIVVPVQVTPALAPQPVVGGKPDPFAPF